MLIILYHTVKERYHILFCYTLKFECIEKKCSSMMKNGNIFNLTLSPKFKDASPIYKTNFGSDYTCESLWAFLYELCTFIFWNFCPFPKANLLQLRQLRYKVSIDSNFQVIQNIFVYLSPGFGRAIPEYWPFFFKALPL